MRAVKMIVDGVVIVVAEVPSIAVVNQLIGSLVVSRTIESAFAWVDPHVSREIGVRVLDSGINHADLDERGSRLNFPCLGSINIRVSGTTRLTGVFHPPQIAKLS